MAPIAGPVRRTTRTHELDGLRAVAIILVVAAHSVAQFAQRVFDRVGLHYVASGVALATLSGLELFFVLSGTLILGPYLRGRRTFNTRSYLGRRTARLWPPYAAALVFGGLVILLVQVHPTWYSREVLPTFSIRGWVAQLGIINLGWTAFNGAWWSLTLEVIFYALVPALLFGLALTRSKPGSWIFVAIVVAASLMSFLWANTIPLVDHQGIVNLGFVYLPSFLFGMVIARFDLGVSAGMIMAAIGLLSVLVALGDSSVNAHAGFAVLWAGVIVVATRGDNRIRTWLAEPHLVWLGERSYSLFLVHFSVFYLVDFAISLVVPRRTAVFDVFSRGVGLPLALLVAMVLFWLIERRAAHGLATGDCFWPWHLPALSSRVARLPDSEREASPGDPQRRVVPSGEPRPDPVEPVEGQ